MRFSVIIPLYNKVNYIGTAIQSVMNQTFTDFELLVIDDGSTDQSFKEAQTHENNQIKIFTKTNGGTASARNVGIAKSTGTYVCFLDGDDFWKPNFLELINVLINKFPEAGMYGTGYAFQKKNKTYHPGWHGLPNDKTQLLVPNYFNSILYGEQIITASSVCISKSVLDEFSGFNEQIRYTEDQELWNKIALHYPIALDKTVAAIYRQDAIGMKTKRIPKHELEFAACLQKILDVNKVPSEHIRDAEKIIAANLIGVASLNLMAGDKKTARKFLSDPRTSAMPKRKAAWEKLVSLPTFLVKNMYRLRGLIQQRR